MPKTGTPRPELGDSVRAHVAGSYVIYTEEVRPRRVDVLRILHAARDRDTILRRRKES